MIPDNIQANIMKYLNNGVSGSSQEQKPRFFDNEVSVTNFRYFPLTNNYKTDDGYYIVNMGMYREIVSEPSKPYILVWNVENIIDGDAYLKFQIPSIGNYVADTIHGNSINRDEEGRFYGLISYRNINDTTDQKVYLVLFNDFITDGIIQVNSYYILNNYNGTINGKTTYLNYSEVVYKKGGTYYLLYNDRNNNRNDYVVATLNVGVGTEIEAKFYYYTLTDYNTTDYITIRTTLNIETDTIYGMFLYLTTSNTTKCMYFSIPTNDTQLLNIKQIYNKNGLCVNTNFNTYNNKGNYINAVLYIKNGNDYSYKYVFGRADGTNYEITIPINVTTTTNLILAYTIYENFLFIRVYDIQEIDIRKFYRINQNTIEFIQDIPTTAIINYDRIEFLRQYNLYYMFAFRPGVEVRSFKLIDVPTYGRFKLLKQKLLNSKLFRIIKFKRNK